MFDMFSQEIVLCFFAAMFVIIPTGVFIVVKAAKEAGKQKKKEGEDQ